MKDHFLLTQLDCPHYLIGSEIKMLNYRTTRGTFLALVAEKDILATFLANGFSQITVHYRLHQ
jgi:hypothetical protein